MYGTSALECEIGQNELRLFLEYYIFIYSVCDLGIIFVVCINLSA
jgi:hypothetical protein